MSPGVEQIFPLEVDLGSTELCSEALGKIERRGTPDELAQQRGKLVAKCGILAGSIIFPLQIKECRHQGFRNKASAVGAEVAVLVG